MSHSHPLFPVTMPASWNSANCFKLNDELLNWLLDPSSLTARLKSHCQQFRVELLGQEIQPCLAHEATEDIFTDEPVLVREVLLYCDDIPQVFARSLLPLRSLTGEEQQLAHLGNQSLGQVLFNHPELTRKAIEVAPFVPNSKVSCLAKHLNLSVTGDLWGRRSTFMLKGKPLLVAEVFLPDALAYKHTQKI